MLSFLSNVADSVVGALYRNGVIGDGATVKLNYKCPKGTVAPESFECPDKEEKTGGGADEGTHKPKLMQFMQRWIRHFTRKYPHQKLRNDRDIMRVRTIDEFKKVMNVKTPGVEYKFDGLDLETAKYVGAQLYRLYEKYPFVVKSGALRTVGWYNSDSNECSIDSPDVKETVEARRNVTAHYFYKERAIVINTKLINKSEYGSIVDGSWKEVIPPGIIYRVYNGKEYFGRQTTGYDIESVITHEFGHAVMNYLTADSGVGDKVLDPEKVDGKIPEWYYARGNPLKDIVWYISTNTHHDEVREQISEYATTNEYEFFAEAFTMYVLVKPEKWPDQVKRFARLMDVALDENNYKR